MRQSHTRSTAHEFLQLSGHPVFQVGLEWNAPKFAPKVNQNHSFNNVDDNTLMKQLLIAFSMLIIFIACYIAGTIYYTRYRLIRDKINQLPVFGDFLHIISWEPGEGIVITRNKRIRKHHARINIDNCNHQGGYRLISPLLGDEIFVRLPVSLKVTTVNENDYHTKDSIRITLAARIWWNVDNLYSLIHSPISTISSDEPSLRGKKILDRVDANLNSLASDQMRNLIAVESIAVLMQSTLPSILYRDQNQHNNPTSQYDAKATYSNNQSITNTLRYYLQEIFSAYGIRIDRVDIPTIRLSSEVQEAIDKVWQSRLLPIRTAHEVMARDIDIKHLANLIGIEAATINEILKRFQGTHLLGPIPFIEALMTNILQSKRGNP